MPLYPGDKPAPEIKTFDGSYGKNITLSSILLGSHTGTHFDAPRHFFKEGKTIADYSIENFIGKAVCLHKSTERNRPISLEDTDIKVINRYLPAWVILRTGFDRYWGLSRYFESHPSISLSLLDFLIGKGVIGIGCDFPSVDAADAEKDDFPIHRKWMGAGRLVIENLCNLERLPEGVVFQLFALPLKMATDGAPARVVAVL
jgi:arylformamidase